MDKYMVLILSFLKIGFLNFGGGYGMIPLLQAEAVNNNWLNVSQFTDIVAISQITPGPIALNMATFIGYTQGGFSQAISASVAVSVPSFLIMNVVIKIFKKVENSVFIENLLKALKPVTVAMILSSVLSISKLEFFPMSQNVNYKGALLATLFFVLIYRFKLNPILCISLSAIAGILLF